MPKNPKLRAIATAFALDVPQLVHDAENEILAAWAQAEDEAQLNETSAKFGLSFAVSLDLEKDKMETKLSFSVRHSRSIDRAIPDPNQPELTDFEKAEQANLEEIRKLGKGGKAA